MPQHPRSSEGNDGILCVNFSLPTLSLHVPRLLPNVKLPETRTVHEPEIAETVLWHEQQGGYGGNRFPRQTRYIGSPENESSWRGRGGGSSSSREGLYNHPNFDKLVRSPSFSSRPYHSISSGAESNYRGVFRPQREIGGPTGFRPGSQNLNYSSQVNSEHNVWSARTNSSQMVGHFENLSVSDSVRGLSRGRGYQQQGSRQGERGWYPKSAQDWATRLV